MGCYELALVPAMAVGSRFAAEMSGRMGRMFMVPSCSPDGAKRNPGIAERRKVVPHSASLHAGYRVSLLVARMERSAIRELPSAARLSRIPLRYMRATDGTCLTPP